MGYSPALPLIDMPAFDLFEFRKSSYLRFFGLYHFLILSDPRYRSIISVRFVLFGLDSGSYLNLPICLYRSNSHRIGIATGHIKNQIGGNIS